MALEICTSRNGKTNVDLLSDIYYTLGANGQKTNDVRSSLEYNIAFLGLREDVARETGQEDERLGIAHNQIGVGYLMHGDTDRAHRHFETSLQVYRELPTFDLQMLAFPTANVGMAYWIMGKYAKAEAVIAQGLRERVQRWGENDKESFR